MLIPAIHPTKVKQTELVLHSLYTRPLIIFGTGVVIHSLRIEKVFVLTQLPRVIKVDREISVWGLDLVLEQSGTGNAFLELSSIRLLFH